MGKCFLFIHISTAGSYGHLFINLWVFNYFLKTVADPSFGPQFSDVIMDDSVNSIPIPGMNSETNNEDEDSENDALYDEAVAFVTDSRKASISSVQRKLRIGYNRAARLIETMESAGVVSEAGHNGSREVLAPPPPK